MLEFVDTHAHIHFADYGLDAGQVWRDSLAAGVTRMLAVGCRLEDSKTAIEFARAHDGVWAAVGIHPHEAERFLSSPDNLQNFCKLVDQDKVVAIGEFGLDYYYNNSPRDKQLQLLRLQLEIAQKAELPVVLHIRDAYADFWPVFDNFTGLRGVVHCFTGTEAEAQQALERGLYIALNGIMTFTKDEGQLAAAKMIPLEKLLLETDAPYLTPKPFRGKICKPEHVKYTAAFLAELRGETIEQVATATTENAQKLFKLV